LLTDRALGPLSRLWCIAILLPLADRLLRAVADLERKGWVVNSAFRVVIAAGAVASVVGLAAPVASAETNSKSHVSSVATKTVSVMGASQASASAAKMPKLTCLDIKNPVGVISQTVTIRNNCKLSVKTKISRFACANCGWHTIKHGGKRSESWTRAYKYYGVFSIYQGKNYYNPR
jgi:hypothetical protein